MSIGKPGEPTTLKSLAMRSTYSSLLAGGASMNIGIARIAGWPLQRLPVEDMIEANESTRSGCLAASSWPTIPPIDAPTTCALSMPSSSSSAAASSAMSASVYGSRFGRRSRISRREGGEGPGRVRPPRRRCAVDRQEVKGSIEEEAR